MEGKKKHKRRKRPSQPLDMDAAKRILANIENGSAIETAAVLEGYSLHAPSQWYRIARNETEGEDPNDPYIQACIFFRDGTQLARAKYEQKLVDKWSNAEDWRAAQSMLENRCPERWGNRVRSLAMVVDAMIAVRDKDIGKLMKMFGQAKAKTLLKLLKSFNLIDDAKPNVALMSDEKLAAIAEAAFAPTPEGEADAPAIDYIG